MNVRYKRLLWTIALLLVSMILSAAKVVVLPQGGAVTYFSLLILWLIPFIFGFRYGLIMCILFGIAKFIITIVTGEYVNYNFFAIILEYPLACGSFALGALLKEPAKNDSGLIKEEPFRLKAGYIIGILGALFFYVISAVLFYPADRAGFINNLIYCILYDASYLLFEGAITMILLSIPSVAKAIYYLKHVATLDTSDRDDTLEYF